MKKDRYSTFIFLLILMLHISHGYAQSDKFEQLKQKDISKMTLKECEEAQSICDSIITACADLDEQKVIDALLIKARINRKKCQEISRSFGESARHSLHKALEKQPNNPELLNEMALVTKAVAGKESIRVDLGISDLWEV